MTDGFEQLIEKRKSLKNLNTFGFDQTAELFAKVSSEQEIESAVRYAKANGLVLTVMGGGSNLVIADDIAGLVIQPVGSHINIQAVDDRTTRVTTGAGVNWHALVQKTLAQNIPGLENLSLIPGSVGAAPVQNIGAYGVEVQDRIHSVKALHLPSMQWVCLSASDCQFRYRNSLFKDCKDEYIISEVVFELGTKHEQRSDYATLKQYLREHDITCPTPQQIGDAVVAIRQARLPDPKHIGNAGSFFHNPQLSIEQGEKLKARFPDLPVYPQGNGTVKVAAGWLIDNLGYKGHRAHGVGVHDRQALVLVNTGSGTGWDILQLADEIASAVFDAYGVTLAIEPTVLPK